MTRSPHATAIQINKDATKSEGGDDGDGASAVCRILP